MLKRLGFVDKEKVWGWVRSFECELENERWNGKENVSGRKCLWFGVGVDLGLNSKVFKGKEINKGLKSVGDKWWGGSDWNSILVYKYEKGCELKSHVDRSIFDKKVVIVNVSFDRFFGGEVEFLYDEKINKLSNGEVIEFNNKIKHGVNKLENERWSISFRKVIV